MKLIPLGAKILIRVETNKQKKVGDKVIHLETESKEFVKMYVEAIGDDVELNIEIGQEVVLYAHTAAVHHPSVKDMILVSEPDVWGVVDHE